MKNTPHSVSWADDLDAIIAARCRDQSMTVSEYIRKCVREENERAQAKKLLNLANVLPQLGPLAAIAA